MHAAILAGALALTAVAMPAAGCTGGAPITGFRSAHLGASRATVLAGVAKDFPRFGTPAPIDAGDPKTLALELVVPQLNPGPGLARIVYLFDRASDTLSAVNIGWQSPDQPSDDARQAIANAGVRLQQFLLAGPRGCLANRGGVVGPSVVLYHAEDARGVFIELSAGGIALTTAAGARVPSGSAWLKMTYAVTPTPGR